MKRALLICFLAASATLLSAQRVYFVYLQTENNIPFFIRMNDKLSSSTSNGYLILSRLIDSTYPFKLGFPGKNVDLDFSVAVNKKDHGFLIRDFGDKGWGLIDLQTLAVQMSTSPLPAGTNEKNGTAKADPFTDMLARATDDPSIKQNPVFASETQKSPQPVPAVQKEIVKAVEKTDASDGDKKLAGGDKKLAGGDKKLPDGDKEDKKLPDGDKKLAGADKKPAGGDADKNHKQDASAILDAGNKVPNATVNTQHESTTGQTQSLPKNEPQRSVADSLSVGPTVSATAYKRSRVTKLSGTMTTEGIESVFVDATALGNDTVRIFIPSKEIAKQPTQVTTKDVSRSPVDTGTQVIQGRKFLDMDDTAKVVTTAAAGKKEEPKKFSLFTKNKNYETSRSTDPASSSGKKSDAKENKLWPFGKQKSDPGTKTCQAATNDDFLKLRRKMAGRTNDDGMLEEAGKYFKQKCFTTEQLKNLSSMFLSNAGKFHFFQLGFNNVSDKETFPSLESELKDTYYANEFRSMLHN